MFAASAGNTIASKRRKKLPKNTTTTTATSKTQKGEKMKAYGLEAATNNLIKKYADRGRKSAEIGIKKIMQTSEVIPATVRAIRTAIVIGIFAALFAA